MGNKIVSSSFDCGDGIIGTIMDTQNDIPQEVFDELVTACMAIAPKLYEVAYEHLDRFDPEEQELIKILSGHYEEEESDE